MIKRYSVSIVLILTILVFLSCTTEAVENSTADQQKITEGQWRIIFDIGKEKLPMNLSILRGEISEFKVVFRNGEENIIAENVTIIEDSLFIEMPLFSSKFCFNILEKNSLSGYWVNYNKSPNYKIPVQGIYGENYRFNKADNTKHSLAEKWEVSFSPNDPEEMYKAVGLFRSDEDNVVRGTFITETGDYRYLEGNIVGDILKLSCFDGAHLFMFTADITGDSLINGMFYSGNHYDEPWEARVNKDFELRDPEKLTQVVGDDSWKDVVVKNIDGQKLKIGDFASKDKVKIIQILGTWCPNCIDETIFYKELVAKESSIEIIPVCFEKEATAYDAIKKLKSRLDLPYELYLGGKLSKKAALELFPMLSNVSSFPTSIFIDKKGMIRKIHTGFYGPGTGEYYNTYKRDMTSFIEELLSETN